MTVSSAKRLVRIYCENAEVLVDDKLSVCLAARLRTDNILSDERSRAQLDEFLTAFMSAYVEARQGERSYVPDPMLVFYTSSPEQSQIMHAVTAMFEASPNGVARDFLTELSRDREISAEARDIAEWSLRRA